MEKLNYDQRLDLCRQVADGVLCAEHIARGYITDARIQALVAARLGPAEQAAFLAASAPISRPAAHGPGPIARARAAKPPPVVTTKAPARPAEEEPVVETRTLLQRFEAAEVAAGITPMRQAPIAASAMARAMGLEEVQVGVVDLGERLVLGVDVGTRIGRSLGTMPSAQGPADASAMARAMGLEEVQVGVVDLGERLILGVEVARTTSAPLSREMIAGAL